MSEEYFLTIPDSILSPGLLEEMRCWLREHLPVPSIEVEDNLWMLFSSEEERSVVYQIMENNPEYRCASCAAIRLVPEAAVLYTVRDPVTDQALRTFARWCMNRASLRLEDGGYPISPDDLVDPELYNE